MAEEEKINTDIDDWLNDLDEEGSAVEELDQADIDSLLGGDTEIAENGDSGVEELGGELDQADIDSLLGGPDTDGEENAAEAVLEDGTIDQEEMDKLFGSSSGEVMEGEDVDFADILGEQDDMVLPDLGDETAFDADAFTLEPDVESEATVLQPASPAPVKQSSPEAAKGAKEFPETGEETLDAAIAEGASKVPLYRNSAVQMLLGVLLVLVLGGGLYFFLLNDEQEEPAIAIEETKPEMPPQSLVEPPPAEKTNHKPLAAGNLFEMPAEGGEVRVRLQADDADGDELVFELVDLPKHGRLSGDAPELVYLPNADFPGKDSFAFRVHDGKADSEKAVLQITGPNLAAIKAAPVRSPEEDKKVAPKPVIVVAAADVVMATSSTDRLVIDWLAVWREAGNGAPGAGAGIEINAALLQGKLEKIDEWHSLYQPPKFYEGEDFISYRFKKDSKYSTKRLVTISVLPGDHEPEINLAPLAASFLTGQSVVIDARASRDDQRDRLRFIWQQLSGVPVQLEAKNGEGSVVSFIMPSTFAADREAGLVIQLTAVDAGGKRASKDIFLRAVSRRQDALWSGLSEVTPGITGGEVFAEGIALFR